MAVVANGYVLLCSKNVLFLNANRGNIDTELLRALSNNREGIGVLSPKSLKIAWYFFWGVFAWVLQQIDFGVNWVATYHSTYHTVLW